jgi:hypothetical protein
MSRRTSVRFESDLYDNYETFPIWDSPAGARRCRRAAGWVPESDRTKSSELELLMSEYLKHDLCLRSERPCHS